MKLIVGLGNPGEKYEKTRHNLGFVVVEKFLKNFASARDSEWQDASQFKSQIAKIAWQPRRGKSEDVLLAKPVTYMNNSGLAVTLLASFYKIDAEDIWIVHDEIDIPTGTLKIRFGGSSAGHRGIESVMQKLGTEKFWRFRLGIGEGHGHHEIAGQKMRGVDEYVLSELEAGQLGKGRELIKRSAKALAQGLEEGLESAMNQFNTK